ncbi:MAG: hypothetical protein IJC16_09810 [Rikenellaceae bacterium]|nr:hypothetical protein [Rikenellaceae bacterium]
MTRPIPPSDDQVSDTHSGFTYIASARPLVTLHKKYLRAFLRELRDTSHHIYALLDALPGKWFEIVRYFDYRNRYGGQEYLQVTSACSLKMFYRNVGNYHACDCFRVLFYGEVYYYEQELTVGRLSKHYEHFLMSRCEEGLRNNAPLVLTCELIRRYGLTCRDVVIVNIYLERFNEATILKLQEQYDQLRLLDCIDK